MTDREDDTLSLADRTQVLAEELPGIEQRAAEADVIDIESAIVRALLAELRDLRDERDSWRANAAATLWSLRVSIEAAEKRGDTDLAIHLRVNVMRPQWAALRDALAGEYGARCIHDCHKLLRKGDAVIVYSDESPGHVDCRNPQQADPLPEHAERYDPGFDDTEVRAEFAKARDFLAGPADPAPPAEAAADPTCKACNGEQPGCTECGGSGVSKEARGVRP